MADRVLRRSTRERKASNRYAPAPFSKSSCKGRSAELKWNPNDIFEVNIVEKKDGMIKLHYVGYDNKYDTWVAATKNDPIPVAKLVKRSVPSCDSLVERSSNFKDNFHAAVKRSLTVHRSDNPDIRLSVPCDIDVWDSLDVSSLNLINLELHFGKGWFYRIVNSRGDFAYIIDDTLNIKHHHPKPIKEYSYHGGAYLETFKESASEVIITFTKGCGNGFYLPKFLDSLR